MKFTPEIFFLLLFQDLLDDSFDFINKSLATGHGMGVFDVLSAMGTFGLDEERPFDAGLTINFGAMWAHHDIFSECITNLAGQELFKLFLRFRVFLGNCGLFMHEVEKRFLENEEFYECGFEVG